jgi:hypothetical protein
MNERIRELWSQAGGHYDRGNQHTWPQYTIDDPEKFAELIVRECAQIAVFKDSGIVATADVAGYMAAGRSIAARLIQEHFGVEE